MAGAGVTAAGVTAAGVTAAASVTAASKTIPLFFYFLLSNNNYRNRKRITKGIILKKPSASECSICNIIYT
jgi:hypothetical protein